MRPQARSPTTCAHCSMIHKPRAGCSSPWLLKMHRRWFHRCESAEFERRRSGMCVRPLPLPLAAPVSFCDDEPACFSDAMTKASYNSASKGLQDSHLYRLLPGVNELLLSPAGQLLLASHPRPRVLAVTRAGLAALRREIANGRHTSQSLQEAVETLGDRIANQLASPRSYSLRPVINATGVILHTNLGRAPLSEAALEHIAEVAQDYCNLELDLETGGRSRRDVHVESLLLKALEVPNPESYGALIVNNCAAATFLALNSLADKQEVIVSRGELVEIGGGFRIPEILEKSGAVLKEVGTTNRTRLSDYERSLSPATALLL